MKDLAEKITTNQKSRSKDKNSEVQITKRNRDFLLPARHCGAFYYREARYEQSA